MKKMEKAPWVDQIEFDKSKEESTDPYTYLLIDIQENAFLQEDYIHYVIQVNNSEGVQEMSTIHTYYDPSYQSIHFHEINIHREQEIIPKSFDKFKFLQRESDLKRALYDGSISVINELEDIRPGDIIEYSYTRTGYNPAYAKHRFSSFYQEYSIYIDKLYQTYLIDKEVNIKYYLDAKEANISKEDNLWKYQWQLEEIEPTYYDYTIPSWQDQYKMVSLSTMHNWGEVVEWAKQLYKLSDKDKKALKREVQKQLSFGGTETDVLDAIRFVQDEIRYLGFEEGIHAFLPHNPRDVYKQRFGDCKDKSFLLSTILNEMGVVASPLLVHSDKGQTLDSRPPGPNQFDHCIVSFNFKGKDYFIDPTISNQGGDLAHYTIPEYGKGLKIKDGSNTLINIKENQIAPLIIIDELIEIDSIGGGGRLSISTKYTGGQADNERSFFASTNRSDIKQNYEKFYKSTYPKLKIENVEIIDSNRETKNTITIKESYLIEDIWEEDEKYLKLQLYPQVIDSHIEGTPNEKDSMPYYLGSRKEIIQTTKVKLPEEWNIYPEETNISNKYFDYTSSISYFKQNLTIKHRYFIKEDIVLAENVNKVLSDLTKISDEIVYSLSYNRLLLKSENNKITWQICLAWLLGILLAFLLAYWMYIIYDPPSNQNGREMQIGGWLVLPAIGILLSPLFIFGEFVNSYAEGLYNVSNWELLYSESGLGFISYYFIEQCLNTILLFSTVAICFLFFQRRTNVPKLMVAFYLFNLGLQFFACFFSYAMNYAESIWEYSLLASIVKCSIWIPYFLVSERVKNTFIIRRNPSEMEAKNT